MVCLAWRVPPTELLLDTTMYDPLFSTFHTTEPDTLHFYDNVGRVVLVTLWIYLLRICKFTIWSARCIHLHGVQRDVEWSWIVLDDVQATGGSQKKIGYLRTRDNLKRNRNWLISKRTVTALVRPIIGFSFFLLNDCSRDTTCIWQNGRK